MYFFDSFLPLCAKKKEVKKMFLIKKNAKVRDFYKIILDVCKSIAKLSLNKDCRFAARNKSRQRKEVLQNTSETISDKQLNLEELVAEYEKESAEHVQANKPASFYEIVTWLSVLKNRDDYQKRLKVLKEEQQNKEIAERYFDKLKRKSIIDAQFLREKSFREQRLAQIQTEIDYQEIYDKTKNMRRVVDAYNLQNIK